MFNLGKAVLSLDCTSVVLNRTFFYSFAIALLIKNVRTFSACIMDVSLYFKRKERDEECQQIGERCSGVVSFKGVELWV